METNIKNFTNHARIPLKAQVKVIVIVIRSDSGDEPVKKLSFGLHGLTRSTRKIKEINVKFMSSFSPILPICIHANHWRN
jgi:hypothetical protein